MTKHDIDIPNLVKKIRGLKGLTQEEFARDLGVTFATVNSWENEKRFPQPFLLKRLLQIEQEIVATRNEAAAAAGRPRLMARKGPGESK